MKSAENTRRKPGFLDLRFDNLALNQYRSAGHILFWLLYLLYEGLIWGMVDGEYTKRLVCASIELPIKIMATYFTLYILIDRLLIKKKYGLFLLSMAGSMIVFGIFLRMLGYYIIYPLYYPDGLQIPLFFLPKILIGIFVIYSLVAIVASFHLIKHWYNHQYTSQLLQQTAQQLEKEKLAAELKLLKSQINPHFLFNTLSNLYVLTLNQSRNAPEMVHKLSELMSYMLYDSNQNQVPLQKELHYIENYIALEKLRYESLDVSFHVYDNVDGITIAPLLILPFIENSFKHGVSNQLSSAWVRIDVAVQDNLLVVKVENSKITNKVDKIITPVSGIGLVNVKKRLEHIYPNRYQLQIIDEVESYLVILKLEISVSNADTFSGFKKNQIPLKYEVSGSR
jgi:two-component system, LytTR family, sensor kinase